MLSHVEYGHYLRHAVDIIHTSTAKFHTYIVEYNGQLLVSFVNLMHQTALTKKENEFVISSQIFTSIWQILIYKYLTT